MMVNQHARFLVYLLLLCLGLIHVECLTSDRMPKCGLKAEVFFVVDGSMGVGSDTNFNNMMSGIRGIFENLAMEAERGFILGMTQYGDNTAEGQWIPPEGSHTLQYILDHSQNIVWAQTTNSYLDKGLWKMYTRFVDKKRGPDDTQIGVVITNAAATDPGRAKFLAETYRATGIKIVSIAAGISAPTTLLQDIASPGKFLTISYADLATAEKIELLTNLICDMPDLCPKGAPNHNLNPRDCTSFVQCVPDQPNVISSCGLNMFWDTYDLTCKPLNYLVHACVLDPCRNDGGADGRYTYYPFPGDVSSCRAVARCGSGAMGGVECCAFQEVPTKADTKTCVSDTSCTEPACTEWPFQVKPPCLKTAVSGDVSRYMDGTTLTDCPTNKVFSSEDCACTTLIENFAFGNCVPELILDFQGSTITDKSTFGHQVHVEAVNLEGGAGRFDGSTSCIRVPHFNNVDWGAYLEIIVSFKEDVTSEMAAEAIISNAGCEVYESSFSVSHSRANSGDLHGRVFTGEEGTLSEVNSDVGGWKTVALKYDAFSTAMTFVEYFGVSSSNTIQTVLHGNMKRVKCDLSIGCGFGLRHFQGLIDNVKISRCIEPSTP